jgi:spore germination protein
MYKRIAAFLFPVTALFLVGAAVWGYQENQEKNAILIKAENQYQRAFHDLTYHVNAMEDELSKAQVVATDGGTRRCLVNVWRMSSQAISEINQLPLTLMPFHKTERFLSDISQFTYDVSVRDLSKKPLTDEEKKRLKDLKKEAEKISKELSTVREKVIDNRLRWMDVEVAIATEDKQMDNTIINGFKTIDENVSQYTATNESPSMLDAADRDEDKKLKGPKLSIEEVKKKAAEFLNLKDTSKVKVTEGGKGLEYEFYSVTAPRDGEDDYVSMDLTQVGGKVIWMIDNRKINQVQINKDQAKREALAFAERHKLENMVIVNEDRYDNVAVFTLAPRQDGVTLYPDNVVIKVALDNGEVTGYQGNGYVFNHRKRNLPKPELSAEEARKRINGKLELLDTDQVLMEKEGHKSEVLAYEFTGKMNGEMFRVYVNAMTGEEEKIIKLKDINTEYSPKKES